MIIFEDPASPDPSHQGNVKSKSVSDSKSNVDDMEHLIKISKILPPTKFGFCIECDNFNKICKSGKASRMLQWVDDTRKYKHERAEEEIQLSVNLLRERDPLPDVDDDPLPDVDD